MEGSREIEKNWVIFPRKDSKQTYMVYGWFPLTIGSTECFEICSDSVPTTQFNVISRNTNVPSFFRYVRGSTNGLYLPEFGETWFIAHVVSYEDRRYYYHLVIALDSATGSLKKYTPLFTFEGEKVEYVLGFERLPSTSNSTGTSTDNFIVGYSLYDRKTKYMVWSKETIMRDFIDYSGA
jgi:hypothetical protein